VTPMSHPERIVPDEEEPGIVAAHVKRYDFAFEACRDKDVLDAGCGVGYGSALLGTAARRVLGVDASGDAIAYALRRYGGTRVGFARMDLAALDVPDRSFDVVCCFETLEHVEDPEQVLGELRRVLRPDGVLFVSTPRADRTTTSPDNPFHRVEFSRDDFEALLRRYFTDIALYGQRREQTARHHLAQRLDLLGLRRRLPVLRRLAGPLLGTPALERASTDDFVIGQDGLDRATEVVAVCRMPA
jgi:SAM-dependent methyltransferase